MDDLDTLLKKFDIIYSHNRLEKDETIIFNNTYRNDYDDINLTETIERSFLIHRREAFYIQEKTAIKHLEPIKKTLATRADWDSYFDTFDPDEVEEYYSDKYKYDINKWENLTDNFNTDCIKTIIESCINLLPYETNKLINIINKIHTTRETKSAIKTGNASIDKIALFNSYLDSLAALYKEETENGGSVENVDTIKKTKNEVIPNYELPESIDIRTIRTCFDKAILKGWAEVNNNKLKWAGVELRSRTVRPSSLVYFIERLHFLIKTSPQWQTYSSYFEIPDLKKNKRDTKRSQPWRGQIDDFFTGIQVEVGGEK